MARIALNQDKIVEATIALAGEIGLENVSFPRLAEHFGIKAPSLYNHFKNMKEVRLATAIHLQKILNRELTQAMIGRTPLEALRAYAVTYRNFSERYAPVYGLVNLIHQTDDPELIQLSIENITMVRRSLENFDLSAEEVLHMSRRYRSTLHGFTTLSQLGYFQTSENISRDDSFNYILESFLRELAEK